MCVVSGDCVARIWSLTRPGARVRWLAAGGDDGLKLNGAVSGGVFGKDAVAGSLAYPLAVCFRRVLQDFGDFGGGFGEQNFRARGEEIFEAGPGIGEDGGTAGGGLEEAHGRRPAGGDHVVAGEVEGEAGAGVEGWVLWRRKVDDAVHVGRPGDIGGVLRAGYDEFFFR